MRRTTKIMLVTKFRKYWKLITKMFQLLTKQNISEFFGKIFNMLLSKKFDLKIVLYKNIKLARYFQK